MGLRRKEPIIAIGGGVCLDVAGLSANLYRRNTPVIKVLLQPAVNLGSQQRPAACDFVVDTVAFVP